MSIQYIVECSAPTPLTANPFLTMANSESEAVRKFFARNGISSTKHPVTVRPADHDIDGLDDPVVVVEIDHDSDAEELTAQSEELTAQSEELTAQSEELTAQSEELTAQSEELPEGLPHDEDSEAEAIAAYLRGNPGATNRAVIEALRQSGIVVQSPQVTAVKKAMADDAS